MYCNLLLLQIFCTFLNTTATYNFKYLPANTTSSHIENNDKFNTAVFDHISRVCFCRPDDLGALSEILLRIVIIPNHEVRFRAMTKCRTRKHNNVLVCARSCKHLFLHCFAWLFCVTLDHVRSVCVIDIFVWNVKGWIIFNGIWSSYNLFVQRKTAATIFFWSSPRLESCETCKW